ncbi:hypothetical protein H257_05466 [Aphanomyces astaci]|uniref:Reverse transcriptase domain-containing protein n=1 Tax=Aphanomyces astaci TaxID=112090 RepID=W4GQD7_APHAT|nr:hypothetical protein H257_05466 [Aphanomyces astaci]ETV81927.1 hypothetical protein H257_05466 [Aphanomyces astaci]|eukprot:XP_009828664.1 hypothetical protein H257_05466 [Aphanomyces astaci]
MDRASPIREAECGRPLHRQITTPFASPRQRNPPSVDQRFQPGGYDQHPIYGTHTDPLDHPFDTPAPVVTPTGATNLPLSPMTTIWDKATGADLCTPRRRSLTALLQRLDQVGVADFHPPKRVVLWVMANHDYRDITEAEWVAWFGKAFKEEPQDLEVLKKILTTANRFDTTILDADSRIGIDNLMRALERNDQASTITWPAEVVPHQLALQRNKPLKTDVNHFLDWLRVHTAGGTSSSGSLCGDEDEGLTADLFQKLRLLLVKHCDVFHLEISHDEPIKVEPLRTHVRELEAASLVYHNNRATWASALGIVPNKDPGDLRMTIDSRRINVYTEPMPKLDADLTALVDARTFVTIDLFKVYWQLALHEDSQMYHSFMTPFGVYTTTRVLIGQTDVVVFCQSAVDFMTQKRPLAWLDDMLGYAETPDDILDLFDQVLTIGSSFVLKLNPKKCDFFLAKTVWCGKVVSIEGVQHSRTRIQGL